MPTTIDGIQVIISGDLDPIKKDLVQLKKDVNSFGEHIKTDISDSIKTMQKTVSIGLAAIGTGVIGLGISSLKTAGDMESLKASLQTALGGSVESVSKKFDELNNFASKTPLQTQEIVKGFIKLKNMGLDPSIKALTSYGDTASAMGKTLNDMVEAVADAATGEFERLKEFGIRSSSEGDKVTFTFKGVSTTVKKESKAIEQYLIKLGEVNFAGGMEKQGKTLGGLWSTLSDNISIALNTIAQKSGLLDFAKIAITNFSDAIQKVDIASIINEIKKVFINMYEAIKPVVNFIFPLLINFFKFLIDNKDATIFALSAIGLAIMASFIPAIVSAVASAFPLIAIFGAIGAAAFMLKKAWDENWFGMRDKIMIAWEFGIKPALEKVVWFLQNFIPNALKILSDTWNNVWPVLSSVLKYAWDYGISPILTAIAFFFTNIIPAAIGVLVGIWNNVLMPVFGAIKWAWDTIIFPVGQMFYQVFAGTIVTAINWIKKAFIDNLLPLWDELKKAYELGIEPIIGKIMQFANAVKGIFNMIKIGVYLIWDDIISYIKLAINTIIDKMNGFIHGINLIIGALNNLPNGGFNIKTIGDIPKLAKGGSFDVPAGYPNDSFLMAVQSGEHVDVTPAGQEASKKQDVVFNIYNTDSKVNVDELTDKIMFRLKRL